MLGQFKCKYFDPSDANVPAAIFNMLATATAISALVSDDWVQIGGPRSHNFPMVNNNNSADGDNFNNHNPGFLQPDHCRRIGIRHFWHAAKFGSFVDVRGVRHTTYHFDGKVLIDCITPLVANLFYVLIAFCFVIMVKSMLACFLSIILPPAGFLSWLKRNMVLEMSSTVLAVLACIITLVASTLIYSTEFFLSVTVGTGTVLIALSGVCAFLAAAVGLRRTCRQARQRRLENQRLLCARSLRSWREAGRRPEDQRPIIDFERYLDTCATPSDGPWEPFPQHF